MSKVFEFGVEPVVRLTIAEDAVLGPGGVVWDAAVVLADTLVREVDEGRLNRDCIAIELGAGVGLPGLALAARGAHVTLTDKSAFVEIQTRNAAENGLATPAGCGSTGRVVVKPFLFGGAMKKLGKRVKYDTIVCSDILGCGDESAYPDLVRSCL